MNVARGTQTNDAVNLGQLNDALAGATNKYLSANDASGTSAGASAIGVGSLSIGGNSIADSTGGLDAALAIGSDSRASTKATAIGPGATASAFNSVSLGTLSVADRAGTVSVGNATNKRQIVNVAAGTQATDAVNVMQLQNVTTLLGGGAKVNTDGTIQAPSYTVAGTSLSTVGDAIGKIDSELTNRVAYDLGNSSHITLGGVGATAPVAISNVAAGALSSSSTDAVNGSQLNSTNQNVSTLQAFATNINNGGGIKFFHSNSQLTDSSATGTNAVAIGGAAVASADNSVAIGASSVATRTNTISVGAAGKERQITNVAAGTASTDAVNVTQLQNVTTLLGGGAKVNADGTIQAPSYTVAGTSLSTVGDVIGKIDSELTNRVAYDLGNSSHITLGGVGATAPVAISNVAAGALSSSSTDAVNGSQLNSTNQNVSTLQAFATNINNGGGIKFFHSNSGLVDSSATGADSVAIGGASVASANNAVALGSNSVADRTNSVSVGAAGEERQITNVAAGTATTDAVNVGQLTAVSNNLNTLDSFAIKYDANADGTPNYEKVTLGGTAATKPTLLTNLSNGQLEADSTDAVNGSQLYATNQNVAGLQDFTNNVNNGGGIKYFHTNSTLADSSATGADSVAVGGASVASGKNSVALGSNSVADRDNSVSVGAAGRERQITNVAPGTAVTDAANVGQLNAVSSNVTALGASAIKYDNNADGTPDYANATLGNGNTGTALHNVAAGTSTMDAVNVGQMNDMMSAVTDLANGAYNPLFTADGDRNSEVATSSGTHSVASGANAVASGVNAVASGATSVASGASAIAVGSNTSATAKNAIAVGANASASGANAVASGTSSVASGNNAVAVGASASASADNGVAVGVNASAAANNAVAIGSGSVADRDNSVSVGSQGNERQITNVAPGIKPTDAANMAQLQGVQQNVNNLSRTAYSGIAMAGALAGLPQVEAGKTFQLSAGAGAYANYAALAVGASARLTQNTIVKLGASATNGSHVLVNAGLGYSW